MLKKIGLKVLRDKRGYELFFIFSIGLLIVYWITDIVIRGISSQQLDLFFSRMNNFWADCTNVVGYSSLRDPYNNEMFTGLSEKGYPPLPYVIMYLFSRLVNMKPYYENVHGNGFLSIYTEPLFLLFFVLYVCLVYLLGYELIKKGKNGCKAIKIGTAAVILLSGPMMFTLERGNIIIWVPFLCMAFILSYQSNNKYLREIGLICLAIAAALKLTPAILGMLLIYDRRWKEAFRAVVYGLLLFFAPFLFLRGGLSNIPLMFRNLSLLYENYSHADGCTIRNLLEYIFSFFNVQISNQSYFTILSGIIGLGLLVYSFQTPILWEKVLSLTLIIIVVPNYSANYCLIYLIPPTILFLNHQEHKPTDILFLVAMVAVFNPIQSMLLHRGYLIGLGIMLVTIGARLLYHLYLSITRRRC